MNVETLVPASFLPRADLAALRAEFPALRPGVRYLDNAATTQKPNAVIDAVAGFYRRGAGNVRRSVHQFSARATAGYDAARATVARFLGAANPEEVVFTRGTTEAVNLVARSFLAPRLTPGDEILVTWMEHHSNLVPWQLVAAQAGALVRPIRVDNHGDLDRDDLIAALGPRARLLAVTHLSNALGTVNPIIELAELAHARGVPVLVDGAQAVPHLAVDVQRLGADFYAFSGHKVYGPSGIGALWARPEHLEAMVPWQGGGDMIRSVSFAGTRYAAPPARFEAGTPNIEGALGLAAALGFLAGCDRTALAAHEAALLNAAVAGLEALPGVRRIGSPRHAAAVVSFVVDGVHPHDLGTVLDSRGVAIRAGHHCAQPLMERFGVPATARASFALYNEPGDIEALVAGVRAAQEVFAG